MKSNRRCRIVTILAACLILLSLGLVLAGCSTTTAPAPPVSPASTPGYSATADGSVVATGYVVREELEGGFWALQDIPVSPSSQIQPKILAVLLPGSVDESRIAALKDAFVRVTGRLSEGASIRMAGPEVLVDAIEPVTSDAPR